MTELTQEYLKEILRYDKDTGLFFWNKRNDCPRTNRLAGSLAGKHIHHGYLRISINGKVHSAHRLAWLYIYGLWPNEIDHINGVRNDNRIINLRPVNRSQNCCNTKKRKDNVSGFKGVCLQREGVWRADIQIGNKKKYLGLFKSKKEAALAYADAASLLHGSYVRAGTAIC